MMRTILQAASVVSLLAIALPAQILAESREEITIGYLDQTLRRLGETGTADRLKKEFAADGSHSATRATSPRRLTSSLGGSGGRAVEQLDDDLRRGSPGGGLH